MNLAQHILIAAVRFYRWILSPAKDALFGPPARCRFDPSCSAYALDALRTHGACKGTWLAFKRVARCHPWGSFGFDPVPPKNGRAGCLTPERGYVADQPQRSRIEDRPLFAGAPAVLPTRCGWSATQPRSALLVTGGEPSIRPTLSVVGNKP